MKLAKKFSNVLESIDNRIDEDDTPKVPISSHPHAIKTLTTISGKTYRLAIVASQGIAGGPRNVSYMYLSDDKKFFGIVKQDNYDFTIVTPETVNSRVYTFLNWV
jgi:hypothetical protein